METRVRTPDGDGDGSEDSSGDGNGDEDDGKGNEDRIGRAEERRKSERNRKIVVDAVRETRETWVGRGKKVKKKGLVQEVLTRII